MPRVPLPIDPLLPRIVASLRTAPSLVLEAPPGAGKTTRVPWALVEGGLLGSGQVIVLQPRRLATRLAAARVAEELGQRVGEAAGYQVRFEEVSGPKTRLLYLTEGVLARRLLSDPELRDVGAVILDEFHERHLQGDLALAMLRSLQSRRKDLKLVVMSATLEGAPVARYLGDCPCLRAEGRRFEVELEHLAAPDSRPVEAQVLSALKRLVSSGASGDVLVFLPGASEIRRSLEACGEYAQRHDFELCALHGDLSSAEQDRAVRPAERRKVILSTNVAETSVTIAGVGAVIDSGLAKVASHSPWSGLPALKVAKVSKASAIQRAGRAGRTRQGRCLRLYTRADFEARPEHETPEIRRMDLADSVLALRAGGVVDLSAFPFFEAPPAAALEAAELLLRRLGAVRADGGVTEIGRRLLRFPVHPRQARLIVEAERRGVASQGAAVAALLGERDLRPEARARVGAESRVLRINSGPSDLLELLDRLEQGAGVDRAAARAVDRVRGQLSRLLDRRAPRPKTPEAEEEALLLSVLAGYPDRVARRRRPHQPELLMFGGGSATLSEASVVREPELLVAVDAEERAGKGPSVVVRLASKIEPEWLLELCPGELSEVDRLEWNPALARVDQVARFSYGNLVLEETRKPAPPSEEAARLLAAQALAAGAERFVPGEELNRWMARLETAAQAFPEAGFPAPGDELVREALNELCRSARSFPELEGPALLAALQARLSPQQRGILSRETPERVALPGGRQVKVSYQRGKAPWVESRLQDFFGLSRGPAVCQGRVPLVLHLLAPNRRAVQVTTDLAGFWSRHYPAIRKELSRRYPRHAWPEDPLRPTS